MSIETFATIVGNIITSLIIIIFITWFTKEYRKEKDIFIKSIMIIIIIAIGFPLFIYLMDKGNFFSKLGYIKNVNVENWHNFISTYGSALVSTLISTIFLVWSTGEQIRSSKEDNAKITLEEIRLQNLPVIKIKITYEKNYNNCPGIIVDNTREDRREIFLNFHINNIGLGPAQNIKYFIITDTNEKFEIKQENDTIYNEKDKTTIDNLIINVPNTLNYHKNILIFIYYDDLIDNRYVQLYEVYIYSESIKDKNNQYIFNVNTMKVKDSKLINEVYTYEDEEAYKQLVLVENSRKEEEKIYKMVKDKKKFDALISKYLHDGINVNEMIADYFRDDYPNMEGGGTSGGIGLRDNKYAYTVAHYSMGKNREEYIQVSKTVEVDIKKMELTKYELAIEKNTLNISNAKLNKFKKYLDKINNKYKQKIK